MNTEPRNNSDNNENKSIGENALDDLGLIRLQSTEEIINKFRTICLDYSIGPVQEDKNFDKKAKAYRYLCSIHIDKEKIYSPTDLLPILRPLEAFVDIGVELEPSERRKISLQKASNMLDISIICMEKAQESFQLPYTNYVIQVHYCLRKHIVRRRYREFELLHTILEKRLAVLPELPPKSIIEKFTVSLERPILFEKYLRRVIRQLSNRGLFSIDIMKFLEIDYETVRIEEEIVIAQLCSQRESSKSGACYNIDAAWLSKWRKYVLLRREPPDSIDNTKLLDNNGKPKKDIKPITDYRSLNQELWQVFKLIYRGGPEIVRCSPDIHSNLLYDEYSAAILIQRKVRGIFGRLDALKARKSVLERTPEYEMEYEYHNDSLVNSTKISQVQNYLIDENKRLKDEAARKIQRIPWKSKKKLDVTRMPEPNLSPTKQNEPSKHRWSLLPSPTAKEYVNINSKLLSPPRRVLLEISSIRDENTKYEYLISAMKNGVKINKGGRAFNKLKLTLFRINEEGTDILWTSRKGSRKLAFKDCTWVICGKPKLAFKSKQDRDNTVILQNKKKDLVLVCDTSNERDLLGFGFNRIISKYNPSTT